jgi:hypothetical protein
MDDNDDANDDQGKHDDYRATYNCTVIGVRVAAGSSSSGGGGGVARVDSDQQEGVNSGDHNDEPSGDGSGGDGISMVFGCPVLDLSRLFDVGSPLVNNIQPVGAVEQLQHLSSFEHVRKTLRD